MASPTIPLRNLTLNPAPAAPTLLSLPDDAIRHICGYLSGLDLSRLQLAVPSARFFAATDGPRLWHAALVRDFGEAPLIRPAPHVGPGGLVDWKRVYREKAVREWQRESRDASYVVEKDALFTRHGRNVWVVGSAAARRDQSKIKLKREGPFGNIRRLDY